jgi:hypothetical protein
VRPTYTPRESLEAVFSLIISLIISEILHGVQYVILKSVHRPMGQNLPALRRMI